MYNQSEVDRVEYTSRRRVGKVRVVYAKASPLRVSHYMTGRYIREVLMRRLIVDGIPAEHVRAVQQVTNAACHRFYLSIYF